MDVHVCVGVWLSMCACVGRCVRRGVGSMWCICTGGLWYVRVNIFGKRYKC